jgi:hypothetical protein
VVAIRNWTLLIPAVPPPAAGHENPGKRKSENFVFGAIILPLDYQKLKRSVGQPTALQSFFCGPSTPSKTRHFQEKSSKSLKSSENLVLNKCILYNCSP